MVLAIGKILSNYSGSFGGSCLRLLLPALVRRSVCPLSRFHIKLFLKLLALNDFKNMRHHAPNCQSRSFLSVRNAFVLSNVRACLSDIALV